MREFRFGHVVGFVAVVAALSAATTVTAFHSQLSSGRGAVERTAFVRTSLSTAAATNENTKTSETTRVVLSADDGTLPPVIQQIADERMEFQINLGRAMDTLRRDMPDMLSRPPDFSIYDDKISVIDPSGVQLTGLDKYKSAFAFFQTFVKFWFSPRSGLQFRMVYDFCRSSIRISWNAVLVPKVPLGRPLYIDGISYYQLDRSSGKIIEHKIEKLIINSKDVTPPYGILSLLQQDAIRMGTPVVPAGVGVPV